MRGGGGVEGGVADCEGEGLGEGWGEEGEGGRGVEKGDSGVEAVEGDVGAGGGEVLGVDF